MRSTLILSKNPVMYIESFFQLSQLVSQPTRVTTTSSTLLDIILTSMPESHVKTEVKRVPLSDHYLVSIVLSIQTKQKIHTHVRFRDFKGFDETCFTVTFVILTYYSI